MRGSGTDDGNDEDDNDGEEEEGSRAACGVGNGGGAEEEEEKSGEPRTAAHLRLALRSAGKATTHRSKICAQA
jgi:hypothetical protein